MKRIINNDDDYQMRFLFDPYSKNMRGLTMRSWYWQALDWLIAEYNFPIEEIFNDIRRDTPWILEGKCLESEMQYQIRLAYDAQIMVRNSLVNDNFLASHWPSAENSINRINKSNNIERRKNNYYENILFRISTKNIKCSTIESFYIKLS